MWHMKALQVHKARSETEGRRKAMLDQTGKSHRRAWSLWGPTESIRMKPLLALLGLMPEELSLRPGRNGVWELGKQEGVLDNQDPSSSYYCMSNRTA